MLVGNSTRANDASKASAQSRAQTRDTAGRQSAPARETGAEIRQNDFLKFR
jgi:hypothetical protein